MRSALAGAGGLLAALLGSLCCVGPLLFVTLGVGAGFASAFEPLRPLFGAVMVSMFGIGFYLVYGRSRAACAVSDDGVLGGNECTDRGKLRREKMFLWGAAALALAVWSFPIWSVFLV